MKKELTKSQQGKKNRNSGRTFELKVRKDLEEKGWIVSKWQNNVEMQKVYENKESTVWHFGCNTKLISAKHKFCGIGRPMAIGTGFPDFIAIYPFPKVMLGLDGGSFDKFKCFASMVIGVEVKSNGYLDKEEKEKCNWLLNNHIFSKILIAKKGEKRGEIIYEEFK